MASMPGPLRALHIEGLERCLRLVQASRGAFNIDLHVGCRVREHLADAVHCLALDTTKHAPQWHPLQLHLVNGLHAWNRSTVL